MWFVSSYPLADAVSIVFSCPSLIIFSSFPIPVGAAFAPSVSFPVSVFGPLGGEAVPVPCGGCLSRGVALRGLAGCLAVSFGGSSLCGAGGGAFWLVFSCGNYRGFVRRLGEGLFALGRA